jgi:hypothetical protein
VNASDCGIASIILFELDAHTPPPRIKKCASSKLKNINRLMKLLAAYWLALMAVVDANGPPAWYVDPITLKIPHQQQQPFESSTKDIDVAGQRGECERVSGLPVRKLI